MTMAETQQIIAAGEVAATKKLLPWWRKADIHAIYPASTDDVVTLLRTQEYNVDESTVAEFIDNGYIPQPARKSGRLVWCALDIAQFAGALEFRRRWQPLSKIHDWKKKSILAFGRASRSGRPEQGISLRGSQGFQH